MKVPEAFRHRITGAFGDAGQQWLSDLPKLVHAAADRWSLEIGPALNLSYNYVVGATQADETPVVLKLLCPDVLAGNEAVALTTFAGDATCRLIAYDSGLRALLLERVHPGTPLARLARENDSKATGIAIDLFQRVWRKPLAEHSFITVADRAAQLQDYRLRFEGGTGPLPESVFQQAEEAFRDLPAHGVGPRLLHGDLHHDNILSSDRGGWLAIDPKGVVGDPGYDLGAFLYNPIPGLLEMDDPARVIARRVDQLAEGLGFERFQVRGWGIAQAVLSCVWSVEDGLDFSHSLTCAEHISEVKA